MPQYLKRDSLTGVPAQHIGHESVITSTHSRQWWWWWERCWNMLVETKICDGSWAIYNWKL